MEIIRDVFLICCFTGLAYADVKKLQKMHINKGIDGEQWIIKNRQKTNIRFAIRLLPSAVTTIEKYKNHPVCVNRDSVPSNQKMNEYLTTVTLLNGIPIESVSQMLGHTNNRTTQHYAKLLDIKVGTEMALLKKKLAIT